MSKNPGFNKLKDVFKKFADNYANDNFDVKGIHIAAATAKAAIDTAQQEFPKPLAARIASDFYATLTGKEFAESLSATIQYFDEETVKALLDKQLEELKKPETTLQIARALKKELAKADATGVEPSEQLGKILEQVGLPAGAQLFVEALIGQVGPIFDDMKNSSDEEVADSIVDLINMIPTDLIAMQVGTFTAMITPDVIEGYAQLAVGFLPSPKATAELLHGVAGEASKSLGEIAVTESKDDMKDIVQMFLVNALDVVNSVYTKDQAPKKKPGKPGFNV